MMMLMERNQFSLSRARCGTRQSACWRHCPAKRRLLPRQGVTFAAFGSQALSLRLLSQCPNHPTQRTRQYLGDQRLFRLRFLPISVPALILPSHSIPDHLRTPSALRYTLHDADACLPHQQ